MRIWIKRNQKPIFYTLFVILLCTFFNKIDPDVYWHIKNGESLLLHGISNQDYFSYWGGNFISHEWLFDIFSYFIFSIGGYTLLKAISFIFIGITFFLAFKVSENKQKTNLILYIIPFIPLFQNIMFLEPRPQILSTLLFVIEIYLLEKDKHLWILPLLTLLTVNIHGGMTLYMILIAFVYIVANFFGENKNTKYLKKMGICIITMILSLFITPYGIECVLYGSKMPEYVLNTVQEWKVTIINYDDMFILFIFLLPLAAMAYTQKAKLVDILMLCLGLMSAFIYLRMILILTPIYIIFGCPYITMAFEKALNKIHFPKIKLYKINLIIPSVLLLFLVIFNVQNITLESSQENSIFSPTIITDYIEENNINVENNIMFNNYNFGGYLIFNGYKTFIDGRADVFVSEFGNEDIFKDYYYIMDVRDNINELIEKYNIKYFAIYKKCKLYNYLTKNDFANILIEDDEFALLENTVLLPN